MSPPSKLVNSFFTALKPPPRLSLSQWADRHAVLSAESSAEAGRWKTLDYQRGIMDAMTDPEIEQVTVMKSARVGYTKILNHLIAYHVHQDPCSMMLVQPTIEDAEGYSKEEIAPMLRDTPCLSGLVIDAKAKDGSNTILQKSFPGGTLGLVGANSPRGFRRVSRRVVMFDEVDGYPPSAGTEGDQIKLGIRRTEYFWNRKIVAGSTPTVKNASRIEKLFEQSDQRRYFVPCPECDHPQYLKWAYLKWPENEPSKAYFECEKNKCVISHDQKRWMISEAERRYLKNKNSGYGWQATAQGNGKHAGFHIWAAYSSSPNAAWGQLAAEFLEAKTDAESLKTFINTVMGELFEEAFSAKVGAEGIKSRVENYEANVVPEKALALVAGVDVQDNRLSISLYGYGRGEESFLVNRMEIFGDLSRPELWKQLDSVLKATYRHETGAEMKIRATCIDSGGHFTHEVYQYVRERRKYNILAIKGSSQKAKPAIGKPKKQDVNFKGQSLKKGVDLYIVGTDTIKSVIYGRLKHNEPGPGYIHFYAGLPDEFFEQLTIEKQITRYVRGFPTQIWVKPPGKRNEALDEAVYAYAALQWLYTRFNRKTIWEQLERTLEFPIEEKKPGSSSEPAKEPDATKEEPKANNELKKVTSVPKVRINRPPGGFVGSW